MSAIGLRQQNKERTRAAIHGAAARLFADRGFERVSVADVAHKAGVSEQTVYNYFPTKEQLVVNRDPEMVSELTRRIRGRAADGSTVAEIRSLVLEAIEAIPESPARRQLVELGYLATVSPAVRRLTHEMAAGQAEALAAAIRDRDPVPPHVAKLRGIALAGIFQILVEEAGLLARAGCDDRQIADGLRPIAEAVLDDLERWF